YQRDLFAALARRADVQIDVCYLDARTPENPWPGKRLERYERVMPGVAIPLGTARVHVNARLPDVRKYDLVILSSFTSVTGQWLMNIGLRDTPWLYWGEVLHAHTGVKRLVQEKLAHPMSRSCGIVAIGKRAEEDYRRRFPDIKHFCIPYHCDLSEFLAIPRSSVEKQAPVFFFCGQMIERKGIDVLLAAFERLVTDGVDGRLMLVGREAELHKYLSSIRTKVRSKIEFCGFQAPEALPRYFSNGDVFVLPSRHDGWGVVINQALAAGMPVISTDSVGAALDLVENEKNGMRVTAGSVGELHGVMARVAKDPGLIVQWGETARQIARGLTPEAGAAKWVSVFEQIRQMSSSRKCV